MVKSQYSVFVIIGKDRFQKEEAIEELRGSICNGRPDPLDYRIFYGRDAQAGEILDYLRTVPFLASKRLAVIKDFDDLPSESISRLMTGLSDPLKSSCLIIDSDSGIPLRDIPGHISIRHFDELNDSAVLSWIKKTARSRGKEIGADAVLALKELQGRDLCAISNELEKLFAFVGQRQKITVNDIAEVVGKNTTSSAFEITRAIGAKKISDALMLTSELISSGKRHYEIVGLLCWHFKRIMKAKMLQARGESDTAIAAILKTGRHSNEFISQVRSFRISQLKSKMSVLLEADLNIKRTQFDPTLILEFAIIKLCLA